MRNSVTTVSVTLLVAVLTAVPCCATSGGGHSNDPSWFTISTAPPTPLPPAYVSVTLDASLVKSSFAPLNFTGVYATNMAKSLAPALLRIGGTSADALSYNISGTLKPMAVGPGMDPPSVMSQEVWDGINHFAADAGWHIIFGLNALKRTTSGTWDSSNAEELIEYTVTKGYPVVGWELGNEPDLWYESYNVTDISPEQHAADFVALKSLLHSIYGRHGLPVPLVIGPDVATLDRNQYFPSFLAAAKQLGSPIDRVTFHQYYLDGHTATEEDFLSPKTLDKLLGDSSAAVNLTHSLYGPQPVWLGETSSAYGGGAPGVSNKFTSTFLWLDKLGVAGAEGVTLLARQDFFGGNYGLLNRSSLAPLPDYWTGSLFKSLAKSQQLTVEGQTDYGRVVRMYAFCAREGPTTGTTGVVVMFLNVQNATATVGVRGLAATPRVEYHITSGLWASQHSLTTTTTLLNGQPLTIHADGTLPHFQGNSVQSGDTPVALAPYSAAFVVYAAASSRC